MGRGRCFLGRRGFDAHWCNSCKLCKVRMAWFRLSVCSQDELLQIAALQQRKNIASEISKEYRKLSVDSGICLVNSCSLNVDIFAGKVGITRYLQSSDKKCRLVRSERASSRPKNRQNQPSPDQLKAEWRPMYI